MMNPFFPAFNVESMTLAVMIICGSLALFAMFYVARHDCKTFEIHYMMLFVATLAVLPVIAAAEGMLALPGTLFTGIIYGGMTWIAQQLRPGKIGMGDIPLIGFISLVSGPHIMIPAFVILLILSTITSAAYSIRRGKRLFKSMFPMALPGMLTAALALGLRLNWPIDLRFWPIDTSHGSDYTIILAFVAVIIIMIGIGLRIHIRSVPKKNIHEREM